MIDKERYTYSDMQNHVSLVLPMAEMFGFDLWLDRYNGWQLQVKGYKPIALGNTRQDVMKHIGNMLESYQCYTYDNMEKE